MNLLKLLFLSLLLTCLSLSRLETVSAAPSPFIIPAAHFYNPLAAVVVKQLDVSNEDFFSTRAQVATFYLLKKGTENDYLQNILNLLIFVPAKNKVQQEWYCEQKEQKVADFLQNLDLISLRIIEAWQSAHPHEKYLPPKSMTETIDYIKAIPREDLPQRPVR